jgi:hypothetical protein
MAVFKRTDSYILVSVQVKNFDFSLKRTHEFSCVNQRTKSGSVSRIEYLLLLPKISLKKKDYDFILSVHIK